MTFTNRMTRHLQENRQGYFDHLSDAWGYAFHSGMASLAFFVHGLLPFTFEHTGSSLNKRVHDDIERKTNETSTDG